MPDLLRPVSLPELRLQSACRRWQVDQNLEGLESLTPVRGWLEAQHHGRALELRADVETIVTLCCDRCLQHFNLPLQAQVQEMVDIAGDDANQGVLAWQGEIEAGGGEDLDDRLDAEGNFDPGHWLFEQLSLRLPLVNRCGPECPGPATWSSDPGSGDPRWAALDHLRA
jgi:uncharacterized protein